MSDWITIEGVAAAIAVLVSVFSLGIGSLRARDSFRVAWTKDVIQWARECVFVMTQMSHDIQTIGGISNEVELKRSDAIERLGRLSSLIDEARFFFENNKNTDWGKSKPSAYQGYRPIILDCLVAAYESYEFGVGNREAVNPTEIETAKREFVSHMQKLVGPKWYAKKAAANVNQVRRDS